MPNEIEKLEKKKWRNDPLLRNRLDCSDSDSEVNISRSVNAKRKKRRILSSSESSTTDHLESTKIKHSDSDSSSNTVL